MGVHERVLETRVRQIGPILRGQNLPHALTHGLRRALERLLNNPDTDDQDRIFFRLSSKNLCCARAIVTAKANMDNHPYWRSFQQGLTIQGDAAIVLHAEANVEPGFCGMNELTRFSMAPSLFLKYRIIMVDVNHAYACFAFGEGEKPLSILHENGHYDTLTSLPVFFSTSYFCERLHPYNNLGQHECPNATGIHCPACCQESCSDYHEEYKTKRLASHGCNSCRRVFYGPSCLELHSSKAQDGKPSGPEKPSVCQERRKCAHCCKLQVGRKEEADHC